MVNRNLSILIILIFGSSFGYSQNWVLKVTPNLKPGSIGLFKSSFKSVGNEYVYFYQDASSSFSNMYIDVDPSMDVFVDFLQFNKWTFGLGFGRIVSFDGIGLGTKVGYDIEIENGFEHRGRGYSLWTFSYTELRHFSISLKYKMRPLTTRIEQSLATHFNLGVNRVEGEYQGPVNSIYAPSGIEINIITDGYYNGLGKNDRIQLGFSLRYEVAFMSKKNKNLLNLNFTYFQGLVKTNHSYHRFDVSLPIEMSTQPFAEARTTSRNSHVSIGISKTFSFDLKNLHKQKL